MKKILLNIKKFILNHKIIVLVSLLILLITVYSTYYILKENKGKEKTSDSIVLKLIGNDEITLKLGEEFVDDGVKLLIDDKESTEKYTTKGSVNNEKIGKYEITYTYKNKTIKRIITVIDDIAPEITLEGKNSITVLEGDKYVEPGYKASDNYDGDITKNVIIDGTIDTSKIGNYKIIYSIIDSSENKSTKERTVEVKKKLVSSPQLPKTEIKDTTPKVTTETASNEIVDMKYSSNGVKVTSSYNDNVTSFYLLNAASNEKKEYTPSKSNNTYTFNIDLSLLNTGSYDLYVVRSTEEKVINKIDKIYQLARTQIGNKLVTFIYDNNNVRIKIEDFSYQYDILIDPGHGGNDPGAINEYMYEKTLNLEQSLYEKERYEAHGLRVYLTRTNDSYGPGLGPSDWVDLRRRSYALGYYGVVSKIVYSNHHNAHPDKNRMGWEIIVPSTYTQAQLSSEFKIASALPSIYPLKENHTRFYTRNNDTDAIFSKELGQTYTFENYYAIQRISHNLFNVKVILYEGCYMSNKDDFNWYYYGNNWKLFSELKIKTYVESLGLAYIPV